MDEPQCDSLGMLTGSVKGATQVHKECIAAPVTLVLNIGVQVTGFMLEVYSHHMDSLLTFYS